MTMRVAIFGTGGVGLSYAAALHTRGHVPVLWSPSGRGTADFAAGRPLAAHGAVETGFVPATAATPAEAVDGAEAVILAVPAGGMRPVIDAAAPHLTARHHVVISSHYSFAALYLLRRMAGRTERPLISGWATTVAAGRRGAGPRVDIQYVRTEIDVASIPAARGGEALASCEAMFGSRFRLRPDFLSIALSNMNPHVHLALVLGNLTRIERAEQWRIYSGITPGLGRLLQALDDERVGLARAAGVEVRSLRAHFALTHDVPEQDLAAMCAQMHRKGRGSPAPATIDTEYIVEDVPYGLWPLILLARKLGYPVPLHEAGMAQLNAVHGRELHRDNNILGPLGFEDLAPADLRAALTRGEIPAGWRASVETA